MAASAKHMRTQTGPSTKVVVLEAVEAVVLAVREVGSRAFDAFQLRLEQARLNADPHTAAWVAGARRSIADGSFEERVRSQPAPHDLAERLKKARPSG